MDKFIGSGDEESRKRQRDHSRQAQDEEESRIQQDTNTARRGTKVGHAEFFLHHERNVRTSLAGSSRPAKSPKRGRTTSREERAMGGLPLRHQWGHFLEVKPDTEKAPVGIEDFVKGVMVEKVRPRVETIAPGSSKTQGEGGKLMKEALQLARNPKAIEQARRKLCQEFSSSSSRRAKEVKRTEVLQLAASVAGHGRPLPVSTDVVEKVSAALKAAGFRSGSQYLGELRLAHVEAGYELNACLTRSFRMCAKALERDKGPVRRAPEVKAVEVVENKKKGFKHKGRALLHPALAYWWAMAWMLREIELREICWEHIQIKQEDKLVTLKICKSKVDQAGSGVRRTLSCCQKESCDPVCAWSLAKRLKELQGEPGEKVFLTVDGKHPSKQDVINSWRWVSGTACTGHSARRSGAMHYVRNGMNISELAYLGRWKSSVVLTYAEEALEEVAANRALIGGDAHWQGSVPVDKEKPDDTMRKGSAPQTPSHQGQVEEHPWASVVSPPSTLWVVTKGKGTANRPVHLVTKASWSIPLVRWTTACGWNFAERPSEFHFIPKPTFVHNRCRKCLTLKDGRDDVKEA